MAPKFSKSKKSKRSSTSTTNLQTPEDCLDQAEEFEIGIKRWRAGDIEKSYRFYTRAIAVYDEGLKRFPKDFDIAYNKANLQYQAATEPRLLEYQTVKLEKDGMSLLTECLNSHRYAMQLNNSNSEILFNTGTVVAHLAEIVADDEDRKDSAITLFHESIELFSVCLTRQEFELEQFRSLQEAVATSEEEFGCDAGRENDEDEGLGEVAEVQEPIFPATLIETALSGLGAIRALVDLLSEEADDRKSISSSLASLQELGSGIIDHKLPVYLNLMEKMPQEREPEAQVNVKVLSLSTSTVSTETNALWVNPLEKAKEDIIVDSIGFRESMLDAEYRNNLNSYQEYAQQLGVLLEDVNFQNQSNAVIISKARALDGFATSVFDNEIVKEDSVLNFVWEALKRAEAGLAPIFKNIGPSSLSKRVMISDSLSKADLFLWRGDISLQQRKLAVSMSTESAAERKDIVMNLVSSAVSYFREAERLGKDFNEDKETVMEARVKIELLEKGSIMEETYKSEPAWVQEIVQRVMEEELIA
jgi:tetratricopeptide (TPR) repeat protein